MLRDKLLIQAYSSWILVTLVGNASRSLKESLRIHIQGQRKCTHSSAQFLFTIYTDQNAKRDHRHQNGQGFLPKLI